MLHYPQPYLSTIRQTTAHKRCIYLAFQSNENLLTVKYAGNFSHVHLLLAVTAILHHHVLYLLLTCHRGSRTYLSFLTIPHIQFSIISLT